MKYLWIFVFLIIQGCKKNSDTEEARQVNVYTVDNNGEPFDIDIVDWSQDITPEVINKLVCDEPSTDCSKRPFAPQITGTVHFKVNYRKPKGEYCIEYFSGEEFIELNESSQNITIEIYYDAVACE